MDDLILLKMEEVLEELEKINKKLDEIQGCKEEKVISLTDIDTRIEEKISLTDIDKHLDDIDNSLSDISWEITTLD